MSAATWKRHELYPVGAPEASKKGVFICNGILASCQPYSWHMTKIVGQGGYAKVDFYLVHVIATVEQKHRSSHPVPWNVPYLPYFVLSHPCYCLTCTSKVQACLVMESATSFCGNAPKKISDEALHPLQQSFYDSGTYNLCNTIGLAKCMVC